MDARWLRPVIATAALALLGASHRTVNFIVEAPTAAGAQQYAQAAERFRKEFALEWLGYELPRWPQPCPISVTVGPQMGAGGATRFVFDNGPNGEPTVSGWQMTVQGSHERVLDSVLPHEVSHTVFASHFRRPLPRWADEGACTTVEHASERTKHEQWLVTFLRTNRGIPFDRMFAMKDYPHDIMPLYAQGHSTARFLIAQGGRRKFVQFLETGFRTSNWPQTVKEHYGYDNLGELQNTWVKWVGAGSREPVAPQWLGSVARQQSQPASSASTNVVAASSRNDQRPAAAGQPLAARVNADLAHAKTPRREEERGADRAEGKLAQTTSWYARGTRTGSVRTDIAAIARATPQAPLGTSPSQGAAVPTANVVSAAHQQAIEPVRQRILEWTRPDRTSPQPLGTQYDASRGEARLWR